MVIQGVLGRGADREETRGEEGGLDTGGSEGWRTKAILRGVKEYREAASLLLVAPDGGISDRPLCENSFNPTKLRNELEKKRIALIIKI